MALAEAEKSRSELMELLGVENRPYFSSYYMKPALQDQVIEMIYPDKPKARNQKYRLTEQGRYLWQQYSEKTR